MSYWSRIKENTSSLTSNLSNLSIANDSDGKEEYETMIHKAFIHFYAEHAGGRYPDWLIENDPTFQSQENNYNVQVTNMSSNSKFYPVQNNSNNHSNPQQYQNRQQPSPSQYNNQGANRYNKGDSNGMHNSQPQSQPQHRGYQSARTHTAASASLQDMYKSSSRTAVGPTSAGNSGGSSSSSSLRDRFQRNNYSGFNRR